MNKLEDQLRKFYSWQMEFPKREERENREYIKE